MMVTNADSLAERRRKLPQWAQDELRMLEADREFWKEQALGGPNDTDTLVHLYPKPSIPLPKGTTIRFVLGDSPDEWIDVRRARESHFNREGDVVVRCGPGALLAALPEATNSLNLRRLRHEEED
jgi:hypothetical protein